jgi:hypothetical protein
MKKLIIGLAMIAMALAFQLDSAHADGPARKLRRVFAPGQQAMGTWHGQYAHPNYARPLAIVVPPNANMMRSQGWGVCGSQMMPLYSQYGTAYPGAVAGNPLHFLTRPAAPSNTQQFGYYYIRGPW